jgi:hypothetical protein
MLFISPVKMLPILSITCALDQLLNGNANLFATTVEQIAVVMSQEEINVKLLL